jgi:D-alanyl-D-alanine carboxypeptidase (penicillin-binding protein 5/6)
MATYTAFANAHVKKLGMSQTTVTDASGFAPATVSTASDLVRLGDAALDNPVVTEIVQQPSATFPGFGTIRSTNRLLGQAGIIGLKTGNTDEAGGCYLSAADVAVNGKSVRVISAIMAAPNLPTALRDTLPIIQSTPSQFQTTRVVRAGQTVGKVITAWGSSSNIVADKTIAITAWSGTTIPALTSKSDVSLPANAGADIGGLELTFQGKTESTDLKLAKQIAGPDAWWRLTHPF